MTHFYLVPTWFLSYAIILEVLFGIITLLVAALAYKVYRISKEREHELFGIGFLLISLSYFVWALLNMFLLEEVSEGVKMLDIHSISMLNTLALYSHIFFFIIGLIILTHIIFKIKCNRSLILILLISLISIIFSARAELIFYLLSSLFFLVLTIHYAEIYIKNKNSTALMILTAFALLLIGNIEFIFASKGCMHFVFIHVIELAGFFLILLSLMKVLHHGKKKKQT